MNRLVYIDILRIIAILGIVLCHCSYGWQQIYLGEYLGSTFNCVFFSISALLFGIGWRDKGKPKFNVFKFILPRYLRIASSLYPFLVVVFSFFFLIGEPFSFKDVLMNFGLLSWFDKLNGFGHLWFLTMLMVCYVLFVILSHLPKNIKTGKVILYGGLGAILIQILAYKIKLPDYFPIVLFYCGLMFLYGDKFIKLIYSWRLKWILLIYIIVNVGVLFAYKFDIYNWNKMFATWGGVLCGLSQLILGIKLFNRVKDNKIIHYFSTISFEIYLVHHSFCFGKFSVYNYTNSYIIGFVLIIVFSLIGAILLHFISEMIYRRLKLLPILKMSN